MAYALDYETLHHDQLKQACSSDAACKSFYNKISSYKYHIIGILNDANVYKQFNYFYIPHFIASTGRSFSYPQFLQLQGHKFAKNFIRFYSPGTLNEEAFYKLNTFISETITYPSPLKW